MSYNKYKQKGAVHWDWYADSDHNYHKLVNESLVPFDGLRGGFILDVGSGDGLVSALLKERGFNVMGVEPSWEGNELATQKITEYFKGERFNMYVECTVEEFVDTYDYEDFDYMYSLNTIEHVDDPTAFVRLMRSMKMGVIVTDDKGKCGKVSDAHTNEFNYDELCELFSEFHIEPLHTTNECFIGIKVLNKQR